MPLFAAAVLPFTLTAAAAGATAGAGIYAANKSSNAAEDASRIQTDAANHAADVQAKSNADTLAFQKQQAAQDYATTNATQQANYGQWAAHEKRASDFGQMFGLSARDIPAYQPLPNTLDSSQTTPNSSTTPSGSTGSTGATGNAAALKTLLDQGMDPHQAVAQFNKQFGRTSGNEAVYYDPSQHGGVATIGLPDAYLAKPGASWDITQRSGGSAAPTAPAAGSNNMLSAMNYGQNTNAYAPVISPALQAPNGINSFAAFLGAR